MAEEGDGKQGDMHYYQNQPYDLEVDINQDEEEGGEGMEKKDEGRADVGAQQDEQAYPEVVATPPMVKALPRFDMSKFEEIDTSVEAKELLTIMKK